jgi:aspartate carbamoyltransferase catalytic subunit
MRDLTRRDIDQLLSQAERFDVALKNRFHFNALTGRVLATLFFQPSLRTRVGFEAAILRLNGSITGNASQAYIAADAQESIADMARVIGTFVDGVILRHGDPHAIYEWSQHSPVPVINAGSGNAAASNHPTQALIDLFTLRREFGQLDGLTVVIAGDPNQRSMRSLLQGLAKYERMEVRLVHPQDAPLDPKLATELRNEGLKLRRFPSVAEAVIGADMVCPIGLSAPPYGPMPEGMRVDVKALARAPDRLIIMHPLPRMMDCNASLDALPHARYFQQAANGIAVRMAILAWIFVGQG